MTDAPTNLSLDPDNWDELRVQGHRMLDDMIDHIEKVRTRPLWQPIPQNIRTRMESPVPLRSSALDAVYAEFADVIAPYAAGNIHPGFMGWVQGGGTAVGMLAEMLAAGLNANLGGRDHMPVGVELQIVAWMRELFGFPDTATGLFVTGTSIANFIALLVAKTGTLGLESRSTGMGNEAVKLRAYTSTAAHGCIAKACEISGLGSNALRKIRVNQDYQIDATALSQAIAQDRADGLRPFMVIGTAGTVDTGAIDDLTALADICARERVAFHVDGAYAALGMMSPVIAPRLAGVERADSIAFDFHKWAQVPYDAGFVLVRNGALHRDTFASPAQYLQRAERGLAGGDYWPCDYGPDLSRGFRALKTWFTLKTFGTERLGAMMAHTCALARYLEFRVRSEPALELLAPAQLNIVCFRRRGHQPDRLNNEVVVALHEKGHSAPSTTVIHGCVAIRAAIFNHRTTRTDIDAMLKEIVEFTVLN